MRPTAFLLSLGALLTAGTLIATGCSSSQSSGAVSDEATEDPFKIPQKDWPDPVDVPMSDVVDVLNDPEDPDGWANIGMFIGEVIAYALNGGFNSSAESVTVQVASFLSDPTQVFVGSCEDGHKNSDDKSQGSVGGSEPAVWTTTFDPDEGEGGNTRVACGIQLAPSSLGDPTSAREGGLLPEVDFNWDAHGSGGFTASIQPGLAAASDFDSQIHVRAYRDNGQGSDGEVVLLIQLGNIPGCPAALCGISYLKPDSDQVTALTDWVSGSDSSASPQPTSSGVTVSQDWPKSLTTGQKVNGTITVTNNTSDDITGGLQIVGEIPPGLSPASVDSSSAECQGNSTFTCDARGNLDKGDSVVLNVSFTPSATGDYQIQVQPKGQDSQYQNESTTVTVSE